MYDRILLYDGDIKALGQATLADQSLHREGFEYHHAMLRLDWAGVDNEVTQGTSILSFQVLGGYKKGSVTEVLIQNAEVSASPAWVVTRTALSITHPVAPNSDTKWYWLRTINIDNTARIPTVFCPVIAFDPIADPNLFDVGTLTINLLLWS